MCVDKTHDDEAHLHHLQRLLTSSELRLTPPWFSSPQQSLTLGLVLMKNSSFCFSAEPLELSEGRGGGAGNDSIPQRISVCICVCVCVSRAKTGSFPDVLD